MARIKEDGIIEAVRYSSNGRIGLVRAYVRRGAAWSDWLLLDRRELVEKLDRGQRFVIGRRRPYLGSLFETGSPVCLVGSGAISNDTAARHDHLAGVPLF